MTGQQCKDNRTHFDDKAAEWDAKRDVYRITRSGADGVVRTYPVFLVTAWAG